ncbi:MAG: hypothetical protein M3T96_05255 [Acidobacteriota bacterium]|nr:hypothetical protein [Acidobacteriota bacterium]
MNERVSRLSPVKKKNPINSNHPNVPYRRPFWLSETAYYALAVAASVIFFFFIGVVLLEGDEESPFLIAGIGALVILGSAVVIREIFLRKSRRRYLLVERKLNEAHTRIPYSFDGGTESQKLSLEKNAEIINEIKRKSEAASKRNGFSGAHREVFETCGEYLSVVENQMETVGVGSPRLAGLRRGREIVGSLHHRHLLAWSEIEARAWSQKARNYATISEKLNAAQEALNVLNSALQFYPNEPRLTESELAIKSFIASVRVSHWIEQAERAAFKGSYKRAVSLYRDALFFLARENVNADEREAVAEKINSEIEKLREISETGSKEVIKGRGKNKKGNEYPKMSEM